MGPGRTLKFLMAVGLLVLAAGGARASGPGELAPWYLDEYGGEPADLARLYDGRLGIVMAREPRPQLYMAWRLLHGQAIGPKAGASLAIPCCDAVDPLAPPGDAPKGVAAWLAARKAVTSPPPAGAAVVETVGEPSEFLSTERPGPNYSSIPNCFDEAFDTAAATLKDRAGHYGAMSTSVTAWIAAQDAVFKACHDTDVALPALPADAPAWLRADHAYQAAALAFYDDRETEAAQAFSAIGRDTASPWRGLGPYLQGRALIREALRRPSPAAFAAARAAIDALAKKPAGTFGQGRIRDMRRILEFRDRPQALLAELETELNAPTPAPDIAVMFRDYSDLADKATKTPEVIDWMTTMMPRDSDGMVAHAETSRVAGLGHARERWTATHDTAWLVAALSLVEVGDAAAGEITDAAGRIPASSPAWPTARYHLVRLGLGHDDPDSLRKSLDAMLARSDLSTSDRNIFTAQRLQVAANLDEFSRFALRRRLCNDDKAKPCVRGRWIADDYQPWGIYDGQGAEGGVGLGEDARALIDRMDIAQRLALARSAVLPEKLRLDIALTSYARAVQLQDNGAIDATAALLGELLPELAADWRRISSTPAGSDKRFAEAFVIAKIPGMRVDLVRYERPEGKVDEFQGHWADWVVLAHGQAAAHPPPPPLAEYQQGGFLASGDGATPATTDNHTDLTCLGECGLAAAPLMSPPFILPGRALAAAERAAFYDPAPTEAERQTLIQAIVAAGKPIPDNLPAKPLPPGAVALWDDMLAYVAAHPADPRSPEALYWLVHVGHYGGSHNHSGRRAFQLLKSRYPDTVWAKKTKYYYD